MMFVYAGLLLGLASGTAAQGSLKEGRDLAAIWCSNCHQVSPHAPERDVAPSFMEMSRRPYLTERFIVDWIVSNNHPGMPNFRLPLDRRRLIASYLRSLALPAGSDREEERDPSHLQPPGFRITSGQGSVTGFYVSDEGHIVSAAHGAEQCSAVTVVRASTKSSGEVVAVDRENDIIVLRSQPSPDIAPISPAEDVQLGESVISFGYPLPTVLSREGVMGVGHINAVRGALDNPAKMQITIPAYPGTSGSPLFDRSGAVVGMITGRINRVLLEEPDQHFVANLTFAVKATTIKSFLDRHGIPYRREKGPGAAIDRLKRAAVRVICEHFPL